jgi:hypothetical protein
MEYEVRLQDVMKNFNFQIPVYFILISCLVQSSILKMEVKVSSETSIEILCKTTELFIRIKPLKECLRKECLVHFIEVYWRAIINYTEPNGRTSVQ